MHFPLLLQACANLKLTSRETTGKVHTRYEPMQWTKKALTNLLDSSLTNRGFYLAKTFL